MSAALGAADYVTSRAAGYGAVREVCDLLLESRSAQTRNNARAGRTNRS
jgi:3-deoxy-D-manno-octulosonate 8-phosphate phosphatase KdsC-like HAD superfamily phosphatase